MIQISVIIPTHNRKIALQNCLTALDLQSFPKDSYEVIVVDDSSNDGTASTVKECQKKCTIQIKYLHYKRSSTHFHASKIRNFGAKHAKGKILLFLDCDMIADPFLIQEHYNHHCKNHACAVMGYRFELPPILLPILGEHFIKNHFHKIKQFPLRLDMRDGIWLNPLFRKNIKKNWRPWLGFYSCNISISKKGFQAVGQFDENFKGWGHEDLELGYRLSKAGIKLVFERNAIGFHQVHALKPLNRQRESRLNINYFHRKHPELEVELLCKGVERILSLNRDLQTLPSMDAYSQNQQAHL
ncbi:MAG: glycosyltransferase, partial [Candidatus Saganbacteria bacterium]|nr:glycosyltransferase [Candidatus Saganbacteria bacterium]